MDILYLVLFGIGVGLLYQVYKYDIRRDDLALFYAFTYVLYVCAMVYVSFSPAPSSDLTLVASLWLFPLAVVLVVSDVVRRRRELAGKSQMDEPIEHEQITQPYDS